MSLFDAEIELAVIDREGPHALVFPCRRALRGWLKSKSGETIAVHPTHWRPSWDQTRASRLRRKADALLPWQSPFQVATVARP